jgi:hypothetical protein
MISEGRIIAVAPLLGFEGHEFIERAYLAVLGRPPDEPGRRTYLRLLAAGRSKHAILQDLADSAEGSVQGARLDQPDSNSPFWLAQIPVFGRLVSFVMDLVRLPSTVIDVHRRQLVMESLSDDLVGRLNRIQENVSWQGEHSRVQIDALARYVRTELLQTNSMSYLTSFMDVRQSRLAAQVASAQQDISEGMRQVAEALAAALQQIGSDTQARLVEARYELVRQLDESSEQLLEAITEQCGAQAKAMAALGDIRAEIDAGIVRMEAGLEAKSGQLIESIVGDGRLQDRVADLDAPLRDSRAHLARISEALIGIPTILEQIQSRVAASPEDFFQSQIGSSVDQITPAAANFLNWAGGHTGYSAQKHVWMNHPFFPVYGHGDVSVGYITERILEIPYVLAAAMKLPLGSSILDCGCCENWVGIALAQFGYNVTGVDVRPYPIQAPNFTFYQESLDTWRGPAGKLDSIVCLSSLEHFGLGAYGDPKSGESTDREVLTKMAGWLKPSGLLILTAPYGTWSVDGFQRVYDSSALRELLSDWVIQEAHYYYTNDGGTWKRGDENLDTHPFQDPGRAVVMLQARRKT